jgi:hypothetical protein
MDANRGDLRKCTSWGRHADMDVSPADARSRPVDGLTEQAEAQRKDTALSTTSPAPFSALELRANPGLRRLRMRFRSMNIDERTFATIQRIAETRDVSFVQVVRLGLAALLEAEPALQRRADR